MCDNFINKYYKESKPVTSDAYDIILKEEI